MLPVTAAERSFIGGRAHNEDCTAVAQQNGHWCLVLSDGAGGHIGGALASRTAVNKIVEGFRARPPTDLPDLTELLLDAHEAVVAAQRGGRNGVQAMHATVVVLTIDQDRGVALWGHVGDSRLYVLRQGSVLSVTRDDSVVQWMVDSGFLPPEEARTHPQKNRLLAALGAEGDLRPSVPESPLRLADGDCFLLCTDGWWDCLAPAEIETALGTAASADDWLDAMAAKISERAREKSSAQDNYSAVACWVGDPRDATRLAE
jgi:serine/threonine protein phosphatase PrpC